MPTSPPVPLALLVWQVSAAVRGMPSLKSPQAASFLDDLVWSFVK